MSTPVSFPMETPRFALPLLFPGQAQKEFFLNQSTSVLDALVQPCVIASQPSPPASANDGDCYRITSTATDTWIGKEDAIAVRIGGAWQFLSPTPGMRLFDQALGAYLHYNVEWKQAVEPDSASGGTTVDVEARQMLTALVEALRNAGFFVNQP